MDLLTTLKPPTESQLSLSAQPSPSASSIPGVSNNNDHLTVSAPSTPTSECTSNLLANLQASSSEDKEERPSLSYKDLIIEAIESSPEKRLKLSEIYQVIRILHPYYRKRADQWGWQNSIRHNLSLHDCFVKLPLKQTSASGVVGHFWTVVRDSDDKQSSSRRRNRSNKLLRTSSTTKLNGTTISKIKDRQSVSSDSGVMSDESQASSPSTLLLESPRKESGLNNLLQIQQAAAAAAAAAAITRSTSLPNPLDPNSLLQKLALNTILENSQQQQQTNSISLPNSATTNVLDNPLINELQRLQLVNVYLQQINNQNNILSNLFIDQQQQQQSNSNNNNNNSNILQLLSLLNATQKVKEQQNTVSSPTSLQPLDLLQQLQNFQQQQQQPQQQQQNFDFSTLLSTISSTPSSTTSQANTITSPTNVSTTLSSILEQQLLNFNSTNNSNNNTTPVSKDNLCVI